MVFQTAVSAQTINQLIATVIKIETEERLGLLQGAGAFTGHLGDLGYHTTLSRLQHLAQLARSVRPCDRAQIYLVISTNGGEVPAGITAYNFLRSLPKRIVTHNIGNIDSIGNAVFLAGQERFANAHATFMFHGVAQQLSNPTRLNANNLAEMLGSVKSDEKRISDIVQERTKITAAMANKFFGEAVTIDAAEALSVGIIDKMLELQIPAGAPIILQPQ